MDFLLDPELTAALRAAGLPFPTSPHAVERFDHVFGPHPARDTDYAEGAALFDRLSAPASARILPFQSSSTARQTDDLYALAARNGADISLAAQEAMRQARDDDPPAT